MKEGRLSSDLQERYGISEENAVGKVLWHSLNENGEIGQYDMKFGNTIIRGLLIENIEPSVVKEHHHDAKRDTDNNRSISENTPGAGDVDKILTPQDMKLINTNAEFAAAIKKIMLHSGNVPLGKQTLIKLQRELPNIIKKSR